MWKHSNQEDFKFRGNRCWMKCIQFLMKGRSTNKRPKYYHKHVLYYAPDYVGPRVLEFLWLDTCTTIVRHCVSLCHCLWVWFFLKTAPRMQQDYEIIVIESMFIITDFFVKIVPECREKRFWRLLSFHSVKLSIGLERSRKCFFVLWALGWN